MVIFVTSWLVMIDLILIVLFMDILSSWTFSHFMWLLKNDLFKINMFILLMLKVCLMSHCHSFTVTISFLTQIHLNLMIVKNNVTCFKVSFYCFLVCSQRSNILIHLWRNSQRTVSTVSSNIVNCLSFIKTVVPLLSLSTVCLVEIYKLLLLWCIITSSWSFHTLCGSLCLVE